jgi:alanine-glyoxylate transaminase/serine-glyoxylate transaminase/serine-pyruvate transaminase
MNTSPLKLMIPGPIQPDQAVLDAMSSPVVPHYGDEWVAYYTGTLALLRSVFNTNGDIFIMVGSGTAAIDACIGSTTKPGEKILIGVNGFFGERLKVIAECYGLNVVTVAADPGKPLQAKDFAKAFQQHPDAVAAAAVHLETSTSVVNPVDQIGPVIRDHGAYFIVDAVSSLGGMTYQMDDWCIDLCASASQKCLGAPPGLAPVAVGSRGWQAVDRYPSKTCGFYTNLAIWRKYAEEWKWHPSPITMAVNNVRALRTSLDQLLDEGIENRLERYKQLALHLRSGLRKIGMQPFTPDEVMSPVLTAAYPPQGVSVAEIMSALENKYRIKIAPGLGELAGKIFRIGHMSPVLTMSDIDELLAALATFRPAANNGQG